MVSERRQVLIGLVLCGFFLLQVVAEKKDSTVTEAFLTEKEAEDELKRAGMDVADIMREVKNLRKRNSYLEGRNRELNDKFQKMTRGYSEEELKPRSEKEKNSGWFSWFRFNKDKVEKEERDEPLRGCKDVKCCIGLMWAIVKGVVGSTWQFCMNPLKANGNGEEEFALLNSIWFSRMLGLLAMFVIYQLVAFVILEIKKIWDAIKYMFGQFLSLPGFTLLFLLWGFLSGFVYYMFGKEAEQKEDPRLKKLEEEIKRVKKQIKKQEEDKKFEKMAKELEALYARLGMEAKDSQMTVQAPQQQQPIQNNVLVKKVPPQGNKQWRCGRCHQLGHTVRECKAKNPAPGATPSRPCFICQGKHFVNDCPNKRRDLATVDQFESAPNPMQTEEVAQVNEETEDCLALTSPTGQKCRVLAAFGDPASGENEVLIDSGATINGIGLNDLIKLNLANKVEVKAGAVAAFNGQKVPFLGMIDIEVWFSADRHETIPFVVFQHLNCPILGTPGIMKFGGQLKFTESGILFETGRDEQQCFAIEGNSDGAGTSQAAQDPN